MNNIARTSTLTCALLALLWLPSTILEEFEDLRFRRGNMDAQRCFGLISAPAFECLHDGLVLVLHLPSILVIEVVNARSMCVDMQVRVGKDKAVVAGQSDQCRMKIAIIGGECFVILEIFSGDRLFHADHGCLHCFKKSINHSRFENDLGRV